MLNKVMSHTASTAITRIHFVFILKYFPADVSNLKSLIDRYDLQAEGRVQWTHFSRFVIFMIRHH